MLSCCELVSLELATTYGFYVISIVIQPLHSMAPNNQKNEILASLDSLDQTQANKVLEFIKGLIYPSNEESYKNLKREAMKEIRQALSKKRRINPAF